MHSLGIHEVVLHGILRDVLGPTEHSFAEDKLAVPPTESCSVAGLLGYSGVLGHGHGGALVSLPLSQDIGNVLVAFDEVLSFWVHLWEGGKEGGRKGGREGGRGREGGGEQQK